MSEGPGSGAPVVVVGGGHAGLLTALALARSGLAPTVIEAEPPARALKASFDGRALALMYGSQRVFAALGLWPAIADVAEPVIGVRVDDPASGGAVDYAASDLGAHPFAYGIENRLLRGRLLREALNRPSITLIAPARIAGLARGRGGIDLRLADGRRITAALVIGADGRRSTVRRLAGISTTWRAYGQTALTFAVRHDGPHGRWVREFLRPAGPLALLPIGRDLSSITWVERSAVADHLLTRPEDALLAALQRRIGPVLGRLALVGRPQGYPLSVHRAHRLVGPRVALIGDAAHGVHPIHAQGLDLGVRDVATLAELVGEAAQAGRDPGEAGTLLRYERWRQPDIDTVVGLTDGLNRLFSTDLAPARLVRRLGLDTLARIAPLKRLAMRRGMGLLDDLPRLARGEAL